MHLLAQHTAAGLSSLNTHRKRRCALLSSLLPWLVCRRAGGAKYSCGYMCAWFATLEVRCMAQIQSKKNGETSQVYGQGPHKSVQFAMALPGAVSTTYFLMYINIPTA